VWVVTETFEGKEWNKNKR